MFVRNVFLSSQNVYILVLVVVFFCLRFLAPPIPIPGVSQSSIMGETKCFFVVFHDLYETTLKTGTEIITSLKYPSGGTSLKHPSGRSACGVRTCECVRVCARVRVCVCAHGLVPLVCLFRHRHSNTCRHKHKWVCVCVCVCARARVRVCVCAHVCARAHARCEISMLPIQNHSTV